MVKRTNKLLPKEEPPVFPIRILGVDTALRTTGYGIVDFDGKNFKVVDCGVIKNKQSMLMSECLRRLSGGVNELISTYSPNVTILEGAFCSFNSHSALMLGAARGAVIAAAAIKGQTIYEYSPTQAKKAVTGWGKADKQQVATMIAKQTGIQLQDVLLDATDALALAMCHGMKLSFMDNLIAATPL